MGPEWLVLLTLLDRATRWGEVIAKAQAEGREITAEEMQEFIDHDDIADERLEAAIAKARDEGR